MKHASDETLDTLNDLLVVVRHYSPPLKEKKRGVFYLKSAAFLHFHEDPAGIFADVKVNGDWVRYPANTQSEWTTILSALQEQLENKI